MRALGRYMAGFKRGGSRLFYCFYGGGKKYVVFRVNSFRKAFKFLLGGTIFKKCKGFS